MSADALRLGLVAGEASGDLLGGLLLQGLKARWPATTWVVTAISGVVPFLSFVVEAKRRKEVTATFQL